jgi:very-short-patch-repair endonuclease
MRQKPSPIEELFALQLRADKLPLPWRQYKFLPDRDYRFDFAWEPIMFSVEVDGEVHRIKERFHADIEKHVLAIIAGWTVMRVDGRSVRDGRAVKWAAQALRQRGLIA